MNRTNQNQDEGRGQALSPVDYSEGPFDKAWSKTFDLKPCVLLLFSGYQSILQRLCSATSISSMKAARHAEPEDGKLPGCRFVVFVYHCQKFSCSDNNNNNNGEVTHIVDWMRQPGS